MRQHLGTAALLVANCATRCFYAHAQPIGSLAHTGDILDVEPQSIKAGESKSYEHIYSQMSEPHSARDDAERNDSGHTHRLIFDSRDGDSGIRWAYGERQGRWKEVGDDEIAIRERPFYG